MNTLPIVTALGAAAWLAYEAFATWAEPLLGVVGIGLVLTLLALVPFAFDEDRRIIMGDRRNREE